MEEISAAAVLLSWFVNLTYSIFGAISPIFGLPMPQGQSSSFDQAY